MHFFMFLLISVQAETSIQDTRDGQFVNMFTCYWLSKGFQTLNTTSNLGLDPLFVDPGQEIYQVVMIKSMSGLTPSACVLAHF